MIEMCAYMNTYKIVFVNVEAPYHHTHTQNIVVIRVEGGVLPELVLILTINGIYSSEEKELA